MKKLFLVLLLALAGTRGHAATPVVPTTIGVGFVNAGGQAGCISNCVGLVINWTYALASGQQDCSTSLTTECIYGFTLTIQPPTGSPIVITPSTTVLTPTTTSYVWNTPSGTLPLGAYTVTLTTTAVTYAVGVYTQSQAIVTVMPLNIIPTVPNNLTATPTT